MKHFILLLILFLLVSCKHERNNEQKLQNEIIRLQKIIEKQDWQQAEFEDSILKEPSDGCGFYKFNVISNSASDYIKISENFKTTISLIQNKTDYIDTLVYSNPSTEKTNYPIFMNKIAFNYDYNCFDLKLKPKTIGWNYFYAKAIIINHRTGNVKEYPVIDSFYVYK